MPFSLFVTVLLNPKETVINVCYIRVVQQNCRIINFAILLTTMYWRLRDENNI